jgi:hypothetical protein
VVSAYATPSSRTIWRRQWHSPLERIHVLNLSSGTWATGAEALLASPAIRRLSRLDLHHHYLSADMMKRLSALGIEIDLSDRQEGDEEDRYCAVSE